jgi:hypothetical protein
MSILFIHERRQRSAFSMRLCSFLGAAYSAAAAEHHSWFRPQVSMRTIADALLCRQVRRLASVSDVRYDLGPIAIRSYGEPARARGLATTPCLAVFGHGYCASLGGANALPDAACLESGIHCRSRG